MTSEDPKSLVLVVEDEDLVRAYAVAMIEEAGFRVVEAANADQAIQILETRPDVSVIFTDVDMPGAMNGIRLAHAVRDRWPPIKIIATSGHHEFNEGDLPTGGQFLTKPYTLSQISEALGGH